jgi:CheY-like chemotaxis protein
MSEMTPGGGSGADGLEAARAARLGTARADFIASLGRRVTELRTTLKGLDQTPGSPRMRDDLRRRVHALSAGAKLLRFSAMASALADAERALERAASVGGLDRDDLGLLAELFEKLPALAWGEPTHEQRSTERPPPSSPLGETTVLPVTALVIGPAGLADATTQEMVQPGQAAIECERSEAVEGALELARALAPDVVVLDADLRGAMELLEKLVRDPLSELPIVVVGTWSQPEQGARWVAAGAMRALPKPVSPSALRTACLELASGSAQSPTYSPLGQPTVDELATRIAAEVRRGLWDAALPQGRTTRIELGDGADVLAAVWAAVARVRELVTIKTGGAVRFTTAGPEGALPIAPWWGQELAAGQRGGTSARTASKGEPETSLDGRRVIVADDDPAVTWFLAGVLRAAGAKVYEAHDGVRAFELCCRLSPELLITDVLMPGLDGFALCRALKRDIALRDVPVILLSWKEDLLQRLRELGAGADGYMRKEASAAAVLQRVGEVLRPRLRIEARLRAGGEVRGRLDGVTPRALLEIVSKALSNARISIRDASFLYEVELREGNPRSCTRTTSDGSFQRGPDIFGAMLGVQAGRFIVLPSAGPVRGILEGDLATQLSVPIARARAAARLLGGTRLLEVHRVKIHTDRVSAYLGATPESARTLVDRLAKGASPRAMVLAGEVAPGPLEDVLCDLAAHGAIAGVEGNGWVDLLGPAVETELATLRRRDAISSPVPPPRIEPPPTRPERVEPPPTRPERADPPAAPSLAPEPFAPVSSLPTPAAPPLGTVGAEDTNLARTPVEIPRPRQRHEWETEEKVAAQPGPRSTSNPVTRGTDPHAKSPSSLEAAVIRQLSEPTPAPAAVVSSPGNDPTIVDMRELRARVPGIQQDTSDKLRGMPSLPPDAMVPDNDPDERSRLQLREAQSGNEVVPSHSDESIPLVAKNDEESTPIPLRTDEESVPLQVAVRGTVEAPVPRPAAPALAPRRPLEPRSPPRAADVERDPQGGWFLGATLAIAAVGVIAFGLRYGAARFGWLSSGSPTPPELAPRAEPGPAPVATLANAGTGSALPSVASPSGAPSAELPAPSATAFAAGVSPAGAPVGPTASVPPAAGEDLPLPAGAVLAPDQGMLDIETAAKDAIFIDGVELGRGPFMRLALAPGVHEVRVRAHGEDRVRFVLVRASRRVRLPLASAWNH